MDSEHWALNHPLSVVGVDSFDPARSCACGYYSSHQSPNTGFPRSCCGGTARLSILSSQWLLGIHLSTKHKAFLKQLNRKRASSPTRNLLAFFLNFLGVPEPEPPGAATPLQWTDYFNKSHQPFHLMEVMDGRCYLDEASPCIISNAKVHQAKGCVHVHMYIYIYICITICNHTSSHIIMSNRT
jgi:hypothetical protein